MSDIWIPKDFKAFEDGDDYSDAEHVARPHGIVFANGKEVASTLMCPHCGNHFIPRKGQIRQRCRIHDAKVCDKPECNATCTDIYATYGVGSSREI
jgi:uncharacterized C2H2 Zn-finger protein